MSCLRLQSKFLLHDGVRVRMCARTWRTRTRGVRARAHHGSAEQRPELTWQRVMNDSVLIQGGAPLAPLKPPVPSELPEPPAASVLIQGAAPLAPPKPPMPGEPPEPAAAGDPPEPPELKRDVADGGVEK